MTMQRPFLRLLLALFIPTAIAWVVPTTRASRSMHLTLKMSNNGVETVSLDSLTNHEEDATLMARSIVAWLDAEWMPQQVHVQMAESAKKSYIQCRKEGDNEIMSIMMQISEDLNKDWFERYDADAFVNAWDVANYVSDYLTKRSGSETCECSNKIY